MVQVSLRLAGIVLFLSKGWTAALSAAIAITILFVFVAFGLHAAAGDAFEMRAVWAMIRGSRVWIVIEEIAAVLERALFLSSLELRWVHTVARPDFRTRLPLLTEGQRVQHANHGQNEPPMSSGTRLLLARGSRCRDCNIGFSVCFLNIGFLLARLTRHCGRRAVATSHQVCVLASYLGNNTLFSR